MGVCFHSSEVCFEVFVCVFFSEVKGFFCSGFCFLYERLSLVYEFVLISCCYFVEPFSDDFAFGKEQVEAVCVVFVVDFYFVFEGGRFCFVFRVYFEVVFSESSGKSFEDDFA